MKRATFATISALACIALLSLSTNAKQVKHKADGAQIYKQHCASCHAGGAHGAKPTKPIVGSKVLSSLPSFKTYLSSPPGHMPFYQDIVGNKQTLDALYKYCKELKAEPANQADVGAIE